MCKYKYVDKIGDLENLAFFKLVSSFGNLEIIKLENLVVW